MSELGVRGLIGQVLARLAGGAGLVACYPAPLGGEGLTDVEDGGDVGLAMAVLGEVVEQLGFAPYRDTGVFVLDLTTDALGASVAALRHRLRLREVHDCWDPYADVACLGSDLSGA